MDTRDDAPAPRPACGAKTKGTGDPCKRPPVPGGTRCNLHGGASPQAKQAAERRLQRMAAEEAVSRHALPRDVDPVTALDEEVRRAAGIVEWLRRRVEELDPAAIVHGTRYIRRTKGPAGTTTVTESGPGIHAWWQLYQQERRHLAAVAVDAIGAGVAERQIRLAEQQGELLAEGLKWLMHELGHDGDEQATAKVVTMLQCLHGGRIPDSGQGSPVATGA